LKESHHSVGDRARIGLFGAFVNEDMKSGIPLGEYGKTPSILIQLQEFTLSKGCSTNS
jgi:hypothetical protein